MTTPSPRISSYGKMKLLVLPIFDNEQNKINLLRLLCQSRGVPICLKGDSNTPKMSWSGITQKRSWGCSLHHQDPVSGTYHYFYYLQVKSWNFRKLWIYLCGFIVTKWCLPCQSLFSVLHQDLSSCSRGQWEKLSQIQRAWKASQSSKRMTCLLHLPLPCLSLRVRVFDCLEGLGTIQKTWPSRVIYVAVPLGLEGQSHSC